MKAVRERLEQESLVLVCLRCGFTRTTTPKKYQEDGGSRCLLCHGSLSAVLSPRREAEIDRLSHYAKKKWRPAAARPPPATPSAARSRLDGDARPRGLHVRGARGAPRASGPARARGPGRGPETARRLLTRLYRNEDAFLTELLRAERVYARTRAFWD